MKHPIWIITLVLALAGQLAAQNPETPVYPGAVATDQDLLAAKDRSESTLSADIDAETLTVPVADGTKFINYGVVTIGLEQMLVCSVAGNTLTICTGGRGFGGTTPAAHVEGTPENPTKVRGNVTASHHNRLAAEIKALEKHTGPVYNVKGYASIQAALDAAGAAGGGTVYAPPGTYLLYAHPIVPSNVAFVGAGMGATILKVGDGEWPASPADPDWQDPTDPNVVSAVVTASGATRVVFRDFTLDMNGANQSNTTYGSSLALGAATHSTVERVQVVNAFHLGQMFACHGTTCADNRFLNNVAKGPGAGSAGCITHTGPGGYFIQGPRNLVQGNYADGLCDEGYIANGIAALDVSFISNTFIGYSAATAFHAEDSSGTYFHNNYCKGPTAACFNAASASGTTAMSDIVFSGNVAEAATQGIGGVGTAAAPMRNLIIKGNVVRNMASHGITVGGTLEYVTITGNESRNNAGVGIIVGGTGTSYPKGVTITGNIADHNGGAGNLDSGIGLWNSQEYPPADDVVIIGNVSGDTQAPQVQEYGIYVQPMNGPPSHWVVAHNDLRNNITAGFGNSGGADFANIVEGPNLLDSADSSMRAPGLVGLGNAYTGLDATGKLTRQTKLLDKGGAVYHATPYNYSVTNGSGLSGDLSGAGESKVVTFTACPEGLQPDERAIDSVSASGTLTVSTTTGVDALIQVTTTGAHGLSDDDIVVVVGVVGNYAANGAWPITVVDGTNFTLNGSWGSGAYDSGGTVYREPLITTTAAHGLADKQWITVSYTSGSPAINGVWPIRLVNTTQFYLRGAPATGDYTGSGIVAKDNYHWAYISGGTGTAEAVLIRGGSCLTAGAAGTLRFDTANTHTNAWSIKTATAGVREAIQACPMTPDTGVASYRGCEVRIPCGLSYIYSPLFVGDGDQYTLLGTYYRGARSSRDNVRLIGCGGSGGTELAYNGADSNDSAQGLVTLAGCRNCEIRGVKLAAAYGATGLRTVIRMVGTSDNLLEDIIGFSNRANGVGLSMESNNSGNQFNKVRASALGAGGFGLLLSVSGFLGQYGSGGASQNVFTACEFTGEQGDTGASAAYIGGADNNLFQETMFYSMGGNKGIYFRVPVFAGGQTTPFYGSFPTENHFVNCPIMGGVGNIGAFSTYGRTSFIPYPVSDGEPTPNLPNVWGRTSLGLGFGVTGEQEGDIVASATTITPTGMIFQVSGTTEIATINLPFVDFAGTICAVPTGTWTTTTSGGNIGLASTAVVGKTLCFTYLPNTSKWYPSY